MFFKWTSNVFQYLLPGFWGEDHQFDWDRLQGWSIFFLYLLLYAAVHSASFLFSFSQAHEYFCSILCPFVQARFGFHQQTTDKLVRFLTHSIGALLVPILLDILEYLFLSQWNHLTAEAKKERDRAHEEVLDEPEVAKQYSFWVLKISSYAYLCLTMARRQVKSFKQLINPLFLLSSVAKLIMGPWSLTCWHAVFIGVSIFAFWLEAYAEQQKESAKTRNRTNVKPCRVPFNDAPIFGDSKEHHIDIRREYTQMFWDEELVGKLWGYVARWPKIITELLFMINGLESKDRSEWWRLYPAIGLLFWINRTGGAFGAWLRNNYPTSTFSRKQSSADSLSTHVKSTNTSRGLSSLVPLRTGNVPPSPKRIKGFGETESLREKSQRDKALFFGDSYRARSDVLAVDFRICGYHIGGKVSHEDTKKAFEKYKFDLENLFCKYASYINTIDKRALFKTNDDLSTFLGELQDNTGTGNNKGINKGCTLFNCIHLHILKNAGIWNNHGMTGDECWLWCRAMPLLCAIYRKHQNGEEIFGTKIYYIDSETERILIDWGIWQFFKQVLKDAGIDGHDVNGPIDTDESNMENCLLMDSSNKASSPGACPQGQSGTCTQTEESLVYNWGVTNGL